MISGFLLLFLSVFFVSGSIVRLPDQENTLMANDGDPNWWKTATIYQIYPKSFLDSNDDGIGDLNGIINKLDYIKELGVQAIWLSPIFDSPQKDGGYDVSNYTKVWKTFGTNDDFKKLVENAHKKGLKVIIDFVPNHTSEKHEWFTKSVNKEKGFEDYYVWADCKYDDKTKLTTPPNNWESVFGGSAWTYNEIRKQCYLHQFLKEQPDLNYRNESVVEAMKEVLEFWLRDYQVDGIRIDAVPHIYEDEKLTNEPYIDNDKNKGLIHKYTQNLPKTFELIKDWRALLDNITNETNANNTRVEFTEATDLRYYGDGRTNMAHFTFNFRFLDLNEKSTAKEIGDIIKSYTDSLKKISGDYVPNWVLGNHDTHRIASKVKPEKVDGLNMLTAFLPGIQVTYQGEELGMTDGKVDCKSQGKDFADNDCKDYKVKSRDFERTPFQWSAKENAEFSTIKPWLPIADDYKKVNVEEEKKSNISHLNLYIAAQKLRNYMKGNASKDIEVRSEGDDKILHLRRTSSSSIVFDFLFNMDKVKVNVTLNPIENIEVLSKTSGETKLREPSSHIIELAPYESVVVAYKNGETTLAFSYVMLLALGLVARF